MEEPDLMASLRTSQAEAEAGQRLLLHNGL